MISGALLLPVEMSTRSFLGRRLNKIIFPTLFWTAVYIILRPKDESLIKTVLTVPFSWQGHPVMWYMYTLIGLYLVAPIISRWLVSSSKRELHFYLLLWSVTLCYPILSLFLHVETGEIGILYYFTGYIGYFVLGYYMKQYGKSISLKRLFIPALLAFISTFAYRISGCRVDTGVVFGYTSIIIALISLFWYVAILRLSHIFESKSACISLIQKTSSLTFGIYLSHISFLKIVWHFTNYINSYPIQTVVSWLLTFALAFVFTYVVSFLPYSRYIIGFQQKSK
jgi:surface polysaccharide O-acyltransferase-like enzyme